jgi:hypothetical protein
LGLVLVFNLRQREFKVKPMRAAIKIILKTILIFCIGIFHSCGRDEVWINGSFQSPDNIVTLFNNKITISMATVDDYGSPIKQIRTYSIVEKLVNDKNKTMSIYILSNDSSKKYSILPEFAIDETHRKFDLKEREYEYKTREEQNSKLNDKIKIRQDSVEYKYVFFGAAKEIGKEFTRK